MARKFGSRGVCLAAPHGTPRDRLCLAGHVACGQFIIVPILCQWQKIGPEKSCSALLATKCVRCLSGRYDDAHRGHT
jgi:hypothetical protein